MSLVRYKQHIVSPSHLSLSFILKHAVCDQLVTVREQSICVRSYGDVAVRVLRQLGASLNTQTADLGAVTLNT